MEPHPHKHEQRTQLRRSRSGWQAFMTGLLPQRPPTEAQQEEMDRTPLVAWIMDASWGVFLAPYHILTLLLCPFPSWLLKNTVALDNRQFPQEGGLKQTLPWRVFKNAEHIPSGCISSDFNGQTECFRCLVLVMWCIRSSTWTPADFRPPSVLTVLLRSSGDEALSKILEAWTRRWRLFLNYETATFEELT